MFGKWFLVFFKNDIWSGNIFFSLRPFLTRKFFEEILGLEGSQNFLGKFRQVHNLKISDRLLRSKIFFQENIPGFICSVFQTGSTKYGRTRMEYK